LEHYHRYHFAARFAKNRRVLDVACGEGYGSAFLAKCASEVIGIDSDQTTIDHAAQKYSSMHNLTFRVDRCETQHDDLGSFDLVVSYETIEHLAQNDQVELLKNVGKILKQDGLFIVSSPEKHEYATAVQDKNQYHKHEMTHAELKSCLESHFKYVYLCGQRILSLSAIWQLEGWQKAQFRFSVKRDLLEDVPDGVSFSQPLYLIALCSNEPISSAIITEANSFYFDTANVEKAKNFYEWAMQMDDDAQRSREVVQNLERQLAERTSWSQDLQREIRKNTELIDAQKREIEDRTQWAQSLENDVAKERAHFAQLKKEWEERTRWAQSLEAEVARERTFSSQINERLMAIESSRIYRLLRKIRLIPGDKDGK
jgi:SAM-dependent methyltransferase